MAGEASINCYKGSYWPLNVTFATGSAVIKCSSSWVCKASRSSSPGWHSQTRCQLPAFSAPHRSHRPVASWRPASNRRFGDHQPPAAHTSKHLFANGESLVNRRKSSVGQRVSSTPCNAPVAIVSFVHFSCMALIIRLWMLVGLCLAMPRTMPRSVWREKGVIHDHPMCTIALHAAAAGPLT